MVGFDAVFCIDVGRISFMWEVSFVMRSHWAFLFSSILTSTTIWGGACERGTEQVCVHLVSLLWVLGGHLVYA